MRMELSKLAGREFDVAVIGAGINGCSAARELAAAGYGVLLVDKGDFAAASSSRSTRLIHCGLRYFAPGGSPWSFLWHPSDLARSFRMTRQAMNARAEFVRDAPERTRIFTFGFPVYRDMAYKSWQVDLALRLVEALGPKSVPLDRRVLRPAEIAKTPLYRDLRDQDELVSVNTYREYQFDWAERVGMDMVLDAERMGAVARNYTPVVGLERTGAKGWSITLADGQGEAGETRISAKLVLNTAGIWIDRVNALANEKARRKILGTKGAHIVIRLPEECRDHGVIGFNRQGKEPVYLVPWRQGLHYMGVTETVYEGDIDDIHATDDEIDWLIAEANHLVPSLGLGRDDVLYTWAGVRPLTYDPKVPKGVRSREIHDLAKDDMPGILAMTAGPVTTHRSAGRELLAAARRQLQPSGPAQAPDYAPRLFPAADSSPALLNSYPDITLANLSHAAEHEQAETLVDLLSRRTGLGWTETMGREGARKAAETVADTLGWDEARIDAEVAAYHAHLDHAHRRPSES